jgi:hypothetical protein
VAEREHRKRACDSCGAVGVQVDRILSVENSESVLYQALDVR